jgi:hypothetical protein
MTEISREYDKLQRRGFRPYSEGHRIMYDFPLQLLRRVRRSEEPLNILEAGFGIGYGLNKMVEGGVIGEYIGYEPDRDSYRYVAEAHGQDPRLTLINAEFAADGRTAFADHTFCIEVIEHVPVDHHLKFLSALRRVTRGTLWLSTPCKDRCPEHGARPCRQWRSLIRDAGFDNVVAHNDQWTTLYVCQ